MGGRGGNDGNNQKYAVIEFQHPGWSSEYCDIVLKSSGTSLQGAEESLKYYQKLEEASRCAADIEKANRPKTGTFADNNSRNPKFFEIIKDCSRPYL